jgi:hypothetical protein
MTFVIIFTLGYAIGGVSALLLIGLTLAGRNGGAHQSVELVNRDEKYSL